MWPSSRLRQPVTAMLLGIAIAIGCAAPGSRTPTAGVRPDGFPTGVFVKTFVDPDLGPTRLSWVFDADGDWAEVPEALAGQAFPTGPARGHYVVEGDLLTLEVDYPSFWGWTRHHWRLDGDRLITEYDDSELPEDASFFDMLDKQPWVRSP